MNKVKIGIGFAVLNNFKGLAETLHSLKTQHDYRLYIMDQWRDNRPLARAWNELAMAAFNDGCDFALVCNDDILFSADCIDAMVRVYQETNAEGVVMVTPNNIMAELPDPYAILNYSLPEGTPTTYSDHPNFSCFLIGRDYFEKVGFFDENFIPAWYEDNDSHRRAEAMGFREICTNAAPMVHFGGVATSMMDNPSSEASRQYYIKKWGGIPISHPGDAQKEHFEHPYNDPAFKPTMWKREDGTVCGPLTKEGDQNVKSK